MIYFLYWLVVTLVVTSFIAVMYKHAKSAKDSATLLGGFVGATLRATTFIWFLVLVYPALKFIN